MAVSPGTAPGHKSSGAGASAAGSVTVVAKRPMASRAGAQCIRFINGSKRKARRGANQMADYFACKAATVAARLGASATFQTSAAGSMRFIKPPRALPGPSSMNRV